MSAKESQFAVIWKEAIDNYEATTKKSLRDPKLPKLSSVDELITTLDSQAKDFKSYREKNQTFFQAFATILRPVELLGDSGSWWGLHSISAKLYDIRCRYLSYNRM